MAIAYSNFNGEWQQCGDKLTRAYAQLNFKHTGLGCVIGTESVKAFSQIDDRKLPPSYLMDRYEALGAALCKA